MTRAEYRQKEFGGGVCCRKRFRLLIGNHMRDAHVQTGQIVAALQIVRSLGDVLHFHLCAPFVLCLSREESTE